MIRRRLIIEWNDDGTDTDEECVQGLILGDWTIEELAALSVAEAERPIGPGLPYRTEITIKIEDVSAEGRKPSETGEG